MAGPAVVYASCLLGGASLYMLLIGQRALSCSGGVGLGVMSLMLLSLRTPISWWSELTPESTASSPLFILCGLTTVVAATMTVTAKRGSNSAIWFLATLIGVAALFLIHDAQYLAAGIVFVGGGMATLMLLVAQRDESISENENVKIMHETWLACCCGCLLAAGLLGAVHRSVESMSIRDSENWPRIVERWQSRVRLVEGQRAITTNQTRSEAAGRSLFEDHGVAMILLAVLLFVALIVSLTLTRESLSLERNRKQNLQKSM